MSKYAFMKMHYDGYLSHYIDLIREHHTRGANTREIAEALYMAGARASTSDPRVPAHGLSRAHHVENLRMMTLYALQRLQLRERKPRGGLLTARRGRDGSWSIPGGTMGNGEARWETGRPDEDLITSVEMETSV
jgi:hypothetical protein